MGINVESAQVIQAAAKLGCLVLKCPFYYLGTRVGGSMTRVQAWQEIVEKVKSRLSKWKSKTLSIGGRLTLLISFLGSIPVFHSLFQSSYKGSKKASWVKWNNVLTDKKRGGLDWLGGEMCLVCLYVEFLEGVSRNNQFESFVDFVRSVTIVPSVQMELESGEYRLYIFGGLCSLSYRMRYAFPYIGVEN
ncbi:hypothetical protein Tco_0188825 [Tanacetum coccineum]